MGNFEYYNVEFGKAKAFDRLVIRGQVKNNCGRDYTAVAIRAILFNKNVAMVSTTIIVNGVGNGMVKDFEKEVEEVEYNKVAKEITRYEIYVESAY